MVEKYHYDDDSPYHVIYTSPGADVIVETGHSGVPVYARPEVRRHATAAVKSSLSVIEVEGTRVGSKAKSITSVHKPSLKKRATVDSTALTHKSPSTITDTLATRICRTSSRNGTFYFAYGPDLSPSYLSAKCALTHDSSSRPIALAKLEGWQWVISARGIANIVPLCEPGIYNDSGKLRSRERETNANIVYGLIYNLHIDDETKVDQRHGYAEHGPLNSDLDLEEASRRPFLQGDNTANKQYQRIDVLEWFADPLREGTNLVKDIRSVKCLVYVDESSRGHRPGRIWDDEMDALSIAVTTSTRRYGLPKKWVEGVMGQHGICILKDRSRKERSRARHAYRNEDEAETDVTSHGHKKQRSRSHHDHREEEEAAEVDIDKREHRKEQPRSYAHHTIREEEETEVDIVKHEHRKVNDQDPNSEYETDDGTIIETRITKRITETDEYDPLPESDFYQEKRGKPRRYSTR